MTLTTTVDGSKARIRLDQAGAVRCSRRAWSLLIVLPMSWLAVYAFTDKAGA